MCPLAADKNGFLSEDKILANSYVGVFEVAL